MNINKELTELLDSVEAGTTGIKCFKSDCREIAKAYGISRGHLINKLSEMTLIRNKALVN